MTPHSDARVAAIEPGFVEGYVTCAFWASLDETAGGGDCPPPMDERWDMQDLAPEAIDSIRKDCRAFIAANLADLEEYVERIERRDASSPEEYAGHDYFLTRNGHGAGFWDRGLGEVGDRLTAASEAAGGALLMPEAGRVYHERG